MSDQASPANTTARVLVVDDNVMSRKLIQYRLDKDGYIVTLAGSGEEALEIVKTEPVSLIFLDMIMEGISGLDVLAALKADARYSDIPVVVVSGAEDVDAAQKCLAAGAMDFLHKPVRATSLQEVVADLIGPAKSTGNEQAAPINIDGLDVLNSAFIAQLTSDYGTETAAKLISRFQDLAPSQLDAIVVAANTSNLDELRRTVSGLKGGARALGLMRLAGVCREIERSLANDQIEDAKSAVENLGDQLESALSILGDLAVGI